MFHSICPECGRVIAPTALECPVCDGPSEGTPAANGNLASAELPVFDLTAPAGDRDPYQTMVAMAEGPTPVVKPQLAVQPVKADVEEIVALGEAIPIETAFPQAAAPTVGGLDLNPVPQREAIPTTLRLPQSGSDGAALQVPTGERIPIWEPDTVPGQIGSSIGPANPEQILAKPAPMLPQTPRKAAFAAPTAAAKAPKPTARKQYKLTTIAATRPTSQAASEPEREPASDLALEPAPEKDVREDPAPPFIGTSVAVPLTRQAAPLRLTGANGAKFRPRTLFPATPKLAAGHMPYGWLASYTAAAHRLMRPSGDQAPAATHTYPFGFQVPSPMLVPSLISFRKQELHTVLPGKLVKRRPMPPWLWATLIGGTLLGAGVSNMVSVSATAPPARHQAVVQAAPDPVALPAEFTAPANSLAKSIEVTGFRLDSNSGKKPEIEYIVVSHSPVRLSGLNVYVTPARCQRRCRSGSGMPVFLCYTGSGAQRSQANVQLH